MKRLTLVTLLLGALLLTGCESRADLETRYSEIGSAIELLERVKADTEDPQVVAELSYLIGQLRQEQASVGDRMKRGGMILGGVGLAIGVLTGGAGGLCWRTIIDIGRRKVAKRMSS